MRHNKAFLEKLATWRELSQAERTAIREHASDCPSCLERLTLYDQQDRLLGAMPEMTSKVTFADVHSRALGRRASFAPQRAWAVVVVLLLFLGLSAGAVAASSDTLPGDLLYPVKLRVEEARMWIAPDDTARDEMDARFAAERRIEAQALLSSNRSADMDIEGDITDVRGSNWTVSGLQVAVPREIWQGEPPSVGQRVEMRVQVKAQEMRALEVQFALLDGPAEGPGQPDLGPGTSPARPGTLTDPAATPRGAIPTDLPVATVEHTAHTAVPQPTGTPVQAVTATHPAGTPYGSVATPDAGAPATATVAAGPPPGSTASPEPGPAGSTRTPAGPHDGQPGGGGR